MPEYYVQFVDGQWEQIELEAFEDYLLGMEKTPWFYEGVKIAIRYQLVVFK